MPYNKNNPQATDSWIESQRSLQNNFQAIFDSFTFDHEPFGDNNEGMHKKVVFPGLSGAPTESLTDSLVLFNMVSALTGINELNMLRPDTAAVQPLTEIDQNNPKGWMKLPSEIIIKWGVGLNKTASSTITFPVGAGIPVFGVIYAVYVAPKGVGYLNKAIKVISYSTTTIDIYVSRMFQQTDATADAYYLAIGK